MFELGHTQIGDCDEVRGGPEASGGALGLLQQAVHRLHVGIAAVVQHAVRSIGSSLEFILFQGEKLKPEQSNHIRFNQSSSIKSASIPCNTCASSY